MGIFDFLDPIRLTIENWLVGLGVTTPPWSSIFLIVVSLLLSSVTGILNRVLLDMEEIEEKSRELQEMRKREQKAKKTADKKLWIKVKREEDRKLELQKDTTFKRMFPTFITIGPFIFLFTTLRRAFQHTANHALNWYCQNPDSAEYKCVVGEARHGAVVVLPFKMHSIPFLGNWFSPYVLDQGLSVAGFSFWYFMSAIVVSQLIQKLFGINITGMQTPGQGGPGLGR